MINIIGAGPVGSYCAALLAKKGFPVNLFDEKKKIGTPVQCTGILTKDIFKFIKEDDFIVNKLKSVKVISKNNYVILPSNEIVVDRTKFDNHILEMAKSNGVKISLGKKFLRNDSNNAFFDKGKSKFDYLMGADGPQSRVAQSNGLYGKRNFILGMQVRVKLQSDSSQYSVFFDSKKFPGFFGWQVPESSKISRIGIAGVNPKSSFKHLLKLLNLVESDVIEYQGGLIPVYNSKMPVYNKNVYLIGDAACQVKATTGGGIVPGFMGARALVKSIVKGTSYSSNLNNINKKLKMHSRIRRILDNFYNKDYDYLINLLKQKRIMDVFRNNTREHPKQLIMKLIIKEPRLLYFLKKVLVQN